MKYEELTQRKRAKASGSIDAPPDDLAELVDAGRRMSPRLDLMDCETVLQMADAIEALAAENARLSASEPQCAVVKPLVWDGFVSGAYRIEIEQGGIANLWRYSAEMVENEEPTLMRGGYLTLISLDDLKATAQADYEDRILSAITLRPEAKVRAEAWAAAIEAALDAADKYMRDQYGVGALSHPIDRVRILDSLSHPADARAALDRIKAEAKDEGMRIGAAREKMRALTEWLNEDEDNGELLMASLDGDTIDTLRAILAAIPEVRK